MINPFQWKNGKAMTPEEVDRARALADAALGRAGDTSPVGHWTQGAARVIDTLGGVLKDKRASKAEKAGLAGADAYVQGNPVLAALLGGGGGNYATGGGYSGGGSSFMAQPTTIPAAPDGPNMGANVSPEELAAMDAASVGSWSGGPIDAMKPEAFSTFGVGQGPDTQYNVPAEPKSYIPEEIKNGIFAGESGGDYNALFGFSNRPGGKFANVKLTDMTVDQALNFADPSGEYGQTVKGQIGRVATPMGAYQVVGTTLRAAKDGLGLTGNEVMTEDLQDRIGAWILAEQGTGAWEGYKGPRDSYTPASGGYSGGGMSSGGSPIPMSGGGAGSMSAITAALSDPWVAKKYGPVLNALMGQEMKRGDMQYEAQLRQSDPMYQAQLKAAEAALQPAPMKPIEVGGVLLDPVTYQPIFDSRTPEATDPFAGTKLVGDQLIAPNGQGGFAPVYSPAPDPGFRMLTPEEVAATPGLDRTKAWQIGPDDKVVQVGGGGTNVTVNNSSGGNPEKVGASLAETQTSAATAIESIDAIMNDPALPKITGAYEGGGGNNVDDLNVFQRGYYGDDGLAAIQKIGQLQNTAWLAARDMLKGGGAITDYESRKAEAAMARLSRAQGTEQFKAALKDLRDAITEGQAKLTAAQGTGVPASGQPAAGQPVQINSDAEYDVLPSGAQFIGPDGVLRMKP